MDQLELRPPARTGGTVRLPGSKSISNRTLLIAALAHGETRVRDLLDSDDTRHMLAALRALGVRCHAEAENAMIVSGTGGEFPVKRGELFLGNAGTAFRPLTGVLAITGGDYRLTGTPRMHERPVEDLVEALRRIGARVDYLGATGYPPLHITKGAITLGRPVTVRGSISSQFVTALLIALPLANRPWTLNVDGDLISKPYVDITLNTLARFGVEIERQGWDTFRVTEPVPYRSPGEVYVEGDASAASYFLAAGVIGALRGGGPVRVEGVGRSSIQGDVRFTDLLEQMGGRVAMGPNWIEATADASVLAKRKLHAVDADVNHIPDAAMTAAVLALFADGTTTLKNIASWRVKETDRIAAMATELRKLGATVEEGADYLSITPPAQLQAGAEIDTYDDHRMAMCFSLAAVGGVPVRINDPRCVGKTFPDYFKVLASVAPEVT